MNRGYIKIWRKIKDNPLWTEKRILSRFEAWFDLISSANGKDKEVFFDGKSLLIKRGQYLTSERSLADRWSWSKTKTRLFLNRLQNTDHMIKKESDHKKTIITILNYEIYNPLHGQKKTTDSDCEKTTERPLTDHRLAPTNKDKECKQKEEKEHPKLKYSDVHLEIAKFLEEGIKECLPRYQLRGKKYLEQWANEARIMQERGEATIEEMKKLIIWIFSKSNFWSKNILSFDKFRKQFGRLWADMEDSGLGGAQVGKPSPSNGLELPDKEWQVIADYLYEKGASQREVAGFYYKQKEIFPRIADKWNKSDKKPKTFLEIINAPETDE